MLSQSCSKRFKNLFSSFNLHQLITVPTRPISGSLIDHIYVTRKDTVFKSCSLPIGLSDHLPIFVTWFIPGNFPKSSIKKHNNLHLRAISINTTICWRDFRSARNRVVHLIEMLNVLSMVILLMLILITQKISGK